MIVEAFVDQLEETLSELKVSISAYCFQLASFSFTL